MALPGMRSTADFGTGERPGDWRSALLLNSPRNNAPLYALTSMMGSERTSDPEFNWWEEDVQMLNFVVSADINNAVTTIPLVSGGTKLKAGDMLRSAHSGEAMRVVSVVSDTSITVTRAMGAGGTPAGTAAALDVSEGVQSKLLFIGSAYREGAPRATGTSYNPVKKSNVCQIFRDPVEITRTAAATTYRTGDPWKNDRRRAAHKHAIGIERALWLGTRYETLESGQPLRFTDGVLSFVPAGNVKTLGSTTNMKQLEDYMAAIFAYGSREKLAWGSIKSMIIINQIVRLNSQYNWGPNEKEYGIDVKRLYTPAGTLTFMEHPLFGQGGDFLADDLFIMDTGDLKYRYIQDTILLKDRQDKGVDGQAEEYLTECGLEVHHGNHHFWLKGLTAAAKDA